MTAQSTRDLIFHTRGIKEGLLSAKIYIQTIPAPELIAKIQEHIDGQEDFELSLMQSLNKSSNPPEALL